MNKKRLTVADLKTVFGGDGEGQQSDPGGSKTPPPPPPPPGKCYVGSLVRYP